MKKILLSIIFFVFIIGCKNYQNEYIDWSQNIKEGSSISEVKKSQPEFVTINWEKPDTIRDGLIGYYVQNINGSNDLLKMSYRLEFENGKFRGAFGLK